MVDARDPNLNVSYLQAAHLSGLGAGPITPFSGEDNANLSFVEFAIDGTGSSVAAFRQVYYNADPDYGSNKILVMPIGSNSFGAPVFSENTGSSVIRYLSMSSTGDRISYAQGTGNTVTSVQKASGTWGIPTPLVSGQPSSLERLFMAANGSRLVMQNGFCDILVSDWTGSGFDTPQALANCSSSAEYGPAISGDGNTVAWIHEPGPSWTDSILTRTYASGAWQAATVAAPDINNYYRSNSTTLSNDGSAITFTKDDNTVKATWANRVVVAPAPNPPAPNPPAPEPEPSASASVVPSASASPSVVPSSPGRLDPVGNPQNPNIPAGGLPAGGSVLLVNGQPVPLTVAPNAPRDPVALVFTAPGMNMRLEGRGDANDPLGLTSKQALILQSEPGAGTTTSASTATARMLDVKRAGKVKPTARTSGDGFAPRSPVKLYLLTIGYLGEVTTDATGSFAGSVPIPPGIAPGVYTLQANGFAPDYSVRSLSIGVLVKPTAARTATARAKVYFDVLSPALSDSAKATLRKAARKARSGTRIVRNVVVGYVQPTNATGNDQSLSTARAQAVAAYLRTLGVKGVYLVRGDGKATQPGPTARRVNIAITYRKG